VLFELETKLLELECTGVLCDRPYYVLRNAAWDVGTYIQHDPDFGTDESSEVLNDLLRHPTRISSHPKGIQGY
jgi:hypothetical protein